MSEIWTIQKVLNWTIKHFREKNVPEARLSAEILLSHALGFKRLDLYLKFDQVLNKNELATFRGYLKRRVKREPVQYITGEQEFMGITFKVSPEVLIPRPETEILVENVIADLKTPQEGQKKILDVGTGSGAIAISIAHFVPETQVLGIDKSPGAINIARENAKNLAVENCRFLLVDAKEINSQSLGKMDVIVTNPPYIGENDRETLPREVIDFEPHSALFAGAEGMDFFKLFLPIAAELLNRGGSLYAEIGYNHKQQIFKLLKDSGFRNISFFKDYQKIERVVKAK